MDTSDSILPGGFPPPEGGDRAVSPDAASWPPPPSPTPPGGEPPASASPSAWPSGWPASPQQGTDAAAFTAAPPPPPPSSDRSSDPWPARPAGFPPPPPPPPLRHRRPPRQRVLLAIGAGFSTLVVLAGVVAAVVRLPYDTVSPGTAYIVNDALSVRGHETFPPRGTVIYATVSVRERVSALQAFIGWLDPATDVIPEERLRGDIPPDQYRQLNVEAMSDSKTAAEILALGRVGYTELGVGALVESTEPGSPAAAVLKDKDVIVAIDATTVRNTTDAVNGIRGHQAGETLHLRVIRDGGAPQDVTADLARAEDGRPLLGVRLSTKVQLPFEITIDSGDVVGPSAGLSYALQLLDLLTPGELTGGVKVAATGELSPTGAVGPIGGIAQKVTTVKRAGAKLFLVPKDNEAEARKHAGSGLRIVGVENFDQALAALGSVQGSNALALAKPPAGT